jgi:hypothetical protein
VSQFAAESLLGLTSYCGPQRQSHSCTIFEGGRSFVARAAGIWAIALDVDGSDDFAGGGMENQQHHLRPCIAENGEIAHLSIPKAVAGPPSIRFPPADPVSSPMARDTMGARIKMPFTPLFTNRPSSLQMRNPATSWHRGLRVERSLS